GGRRGNPVLWGRAHFAAIQQLTGDVGARALLAERADRLVLVETAADGVLIDVDTAEDLEKVRLLLGKNA
ncbi:MAG TPA: 4-diphosphocytidyl-2C-methyl-D-erythritol kinase, partial [Azospirillaceae bacterium]|nr:4-diphosphocytidyl-2C-methyl-D-erythritol kinase [Azospirillaceae bacterium]